MSSIYNNFAEIAKKEATKSQCKFRVGAVAIHRGKIISVGFNRYCSGPCPYRKGTESFHAEQIALSRRGKSSVDTLVVVRIDSNNNFTMAKPCKKCIAHSKRSGIKKIIYSDRLGKLQKITL